MRLGVLGAGQFSRNFIPLWKAHPLITSVTVADLIAERSAEFAETFEVGRAADFDDLLDRVDAVAIFAQRHLHGPLVIKALQAGKHVYSAVPVADSMTEIEEIVRLVAETRLTYMLGETAYYYPSALFCRAEFAKGTFGDFVYAEAQYYHDMNHGFYEAFQYTGGERWREVAGTPPMHYPTHTVAPLVSTTGSYATQVACLGFEDRHPDGVFGRDRNHWGNPFSNETALFRMSNGGVARVNEFRRVGIKKPMTYLGLFLGTRASYEWAGTQHIFATALDDGSMTGEDLSAWLNSTNLEAHRGDPDFFHNVVNGGYDSASMSPIMPAARLPREFGPLPSNHRGVHKFLVDDFARAVHTGKLPPNHVWAAARYNIPGLVAHQSAEQGGITLDIPDLGEPPADWEMLNLSPTITDRR